MSDELKPVRCGCGGEVWAFMTLYPDNRERPYICQCRRCFTRTGGYPTEAEAIAAWNMAMGIAEKSSTVERTAKVIMHKYWLGVSLNVVGEHTIGYEWICENCKKKVIDGDNYCSHCGFKLDWSENERFDK